MKIKKRLLCSVLLLSVWLGFVGSSIWRFGSNDFSQKADCIIVLGAAVQGNAPSPVFRERIKHSINLYNSNISNKVIFTGGTGNGKSHSESTVGRTMAIRVGVSAADIYIEQQSKTTKQNLLEAQKLMKENGFTTAILVSDPLHMKRAIMMAEDLGVRVFSSPTPTTRYRSLKVRLKFLFREIYFYHHYLVMGK